MTPHALPHLLRINDLAYYYDRRTERLKRLSLQEVLAQIDAAWLIESVGRKSAPAFLATLMEKCLKQEDENWGKTVFAAADSRLINVLHDQAIASHKSEYQVTWDMTHNRICREFIPRFCDETGNVHWESLVKFNSGKP